MAVINRLTKDEIKKDYDSYGLFIGILPVYIGDIHGECRLSERNWIPEIAFDIVEGLFGVFCEVSCIINPDFDPVFPIKITGRLV